MKDLRGKKGEKLVDGKFPFFCLDDLTIGQERGPCRFELREGNLLLKLAATIYLSSGGRALDSTTVYYVLGFTENGATKNQVYQKLQNKQKQV